MYGKYNKKINTNQDKTTISAGYDSVIPEIIRPVCKKFHHNTKFQK